MAGNKSRILVPLLPRLWLAPVGTAAPVDPVVALAAPWFDVGFFTTDSLQWGTDPSFQEVKSAQSNWTTRRWQDGDAATVGVDLQEWSGPNFLAVYGGGTLTEVPASVGPPVVTLHYKFVPPTIGGRTETAAILEIIDGSKHYRTVIPRCEQSEGVEIGYDKSKESTLPMRLAILGDDIADPWYLLTDDPAFEPAA